MDTFQQLQQSRRESIGQPDKMSSEIVVQRINDNEIWLYSLNKYQHNIMRPNISDNSVDKRARLITSDDDGGRRRQVLLLRRPS